MRPRPPRRRTFTPCAPHIRNVALVGHSGSGKTQLASAMLFDADAISRLGRVDEVTTVTDFDEEEIARRHTLSASPAYAEWKKTKINLIDTAGMANFFSDTCSAMRVADAAVVVVDAVHGAEVITEKVWNEAATLGLPCVVVLNRLDCVRGNLQRPLESLQSAFGRTVVPIQLPIGVEAELRGVVDLVAMKAITFGDDGRTMSIEEVPDELAAETGAAREALIELVAEADDHLMEQFFEASTLTQEELLVGLQNATAARQVFPWCMRRQRRTWISSRS